MSDDVQAGGCYPSSQAHRYASSVKPQPHGREQCGAAAVASVNRLAVWPHNDPCFELFEASQVPLAKHAGDTLVVCVTDMRSATATAVEQ